MITKDLFEKIKAKYGDVASWAVWENAGDKPKSNMGNMDVFDLQKNPSLLGTLKTDVILVGLNISRHVLPTQPFKNFHDASPHANDFKIRYVFQNTKFYGAYMTDIIKNTEMKSANQIRSYLKNNPYIIEENTALFRQEFSDLGATKPTLLAFGVDAYNILYKNLKRHEYSKLVKLTHYSHQISKEDYQKEVMHQINTAMNYSQGM